MTNRVNTGGEKEDKRAFVGFPLNARSVKASPTSCLRPQFLGSHRITAAAVGRHKQLVQSIAAEAVSENMFRRKFTAENATLRYRCQPSLIQGIPGNISK